MAISALAQPGHPSVLRHQQLQDGLLQVGAMAFGLPRGEDDHGLIAFGSLRTAERQARRVEMLPALRTPFLDTHRKGKLTQEAIPPEVETASRLRPRVLRWHMSAWTPGRTNTSRGVLTTNGGAATRDDGPTLSRSASSLPPLPPR